MAGCVAEEFWKISRAGEIIIESVVYLTKLTAKEGVHFI